MTLAPGASAPYAPIEPLLGTAVSLQAGKETSDLPRPHTYTQLQLGLQYDPAAQVLVVEVHKCARGIDVSVPVRIRVVGLG